MSLFMHTQEKKISCFIFFWGGGGFISVDVLKVLYLPTTHNYLMKLDFLNLNKNLLLVNVQLISYVVELMIKWRLP